MTCINSKSPQQLQPMDPVALGLTTPNAAQYQWPTDPAEQARAAQYWQQWMQWFQSQQPKKEGEEGEDRQEDGAVQVPVLPSLPRRPCGTSGEARAGRGGLLMIPEPWREIVHYGVPFLMGLVFAGGVVQIAREIAASRHLGYPWVNWHQRAAEKWEKELRRSGHWTGPVS